MGLFDVIKYGNTDLSSKEELLKLPIALLDLVWNNAHSDYEIHPVTDHERKCYILSEWTLRGPGAARCARRNFEYTLKEYDEHI